MRQKVTSSIWEKAHCWASSTRNFSLAMSSRIIFLSSALEIRCALITEELIAWKMRCGLMNSVQLNHLSQLRNQKAISFASAEGLDLACSYALKA